MSINLDRNIMKWFDELFEKNLMTISIDDFVCSLLDAKSNADLDTKSNVDLDARANADLTRKNKAEIDTKISLNRANHIYWTIDISLPYKYIRRLRDNVHPLFGGYVYEEISIYEDQEKYRQLNTWLQDLYNSVLDYSYSDIKRAYVLSYRQEFLNMCSNVGIGQKVLIDKDLVFCPINQDKVKFTNLDESIDLNLMYNSSIGESLIDSLLDISRSIIIRRNE